MVGDDELSLEQGYCDGDKKWLREMIQLLDETAQHAARTEYRAVFRQAWRNWEALGIPALRLEGKSRWTANRWLCGYCGEE